MVRERETKTRDGEGKAALDRTFIGADFDDTEEGDDETEEARGLPIERLSPKEIISNQSEAVSAKLGVGKLTVQLEVTILWVRKEQRFFREKLQMQQELGMSNYGGGHNPKTRLMMTEEKEYMEGLYVTNDSGREPRASGSNTGNNPGRDSRGGGSYGKGNTSGYKVI